MKVEGQLFAADSSTLEEAKKHGINFQLFDFSSVDSFERSDVPRVYLASPDHHNKLQKTLTAIKERSLGGPLMLILINDAPSFDYINLAFDFGISDIVSWKQISGRIDHLKSMSSQFIASSRFIMSEVLKTSVALRKANQHGIEESLASIRALEVFDYRVSYLIGKSCEALGDFSNAEASYVKSLQQYGHFRPAAMGLAEVLLVQGRTTEGISYLLNLEKQSGLHLERKALLVAGYADQKNTPEALRIIQVAEQIEKDHPRVLEAKAHVHMALNEFEKLIPLVDRLTDVGPFFTVKLNEAGIALSQGGKGDVALNLYEKAHNIVRPELKFKISLNSALAAYRNGDAVRAMDLLERCESEFGRSFPKLEKIRGVVKGVLATRGAA